MVTEPRKVTQPYQSSGKVQVTPRSPPPPNQTARMKDLGHQLLVRRRRKLPLAEDARSARPPRTSGIVC